MEYDDSRKILLSSKKLVHYSLCPYSRVVRLILSEYKAEYSLIEELFWEQRENFLRLNPSGTLPILIEPDRRTLLCDIYSISEYLCETLDDPEVCLMPNDPLHRAEIRRIVQWFNTKFYQEVSYALLNERVIKRYMRDSYPDSTIIRKAIHGINEHFVYLASLLHQRDWIAGYKMTLADLTAAAHISVVDFLGNISWVNQHYEYEFSLVRDWYARIKSRRSFRDLTTDTIQGFSPPQHYANPDF